MPESDANLAFTPATELLSLISCGEVSSTELTELYLARIEEIDPKLNAYVTVTPEIALEQAAKADEATARGESLGPLHGLPISLKDLQMTKGIRTTGGSLAYKDRVPDANGTERSAHLGRGRCRTREDKLSGIRTPRRHRESTRQILLESVEPGTDLRWIERWGSGRSSCWSLRGRDGW